MPRELPRRSVAIVFALVAVLLAVVPAAAVAVVGDLSAESMADQLVAARSRSVLTQVERRLAATQNGNEAYVELLAAEPRIVEGIESDDWLMMAQGAIPVRSHFDIQEIDVVDTDGNGLLHLSPRDSRHLLPDLVAQARLGLTMSRAEITDGGLLIQAVAPVRSDGRIIAVAVAGRLFDEELLSELAGGEDILLALFDGDGPTVIPSAVRAAWEEQPFDRHATGIVAGHYVATPLELDGDHSILALVDISDVIAVRDQRRQVLFLGGAVLALAGVAIGLLITGRLIRPLTNLTEAARTISRGHYDDRLPRNSFREIDTLSVAFNELAEAVQSRIDQLTAAEQEIRTSLESKNQLIASVSHELRTPLTAIVGYAQMLDDRDVELSGEDRVDMIHLVARESIDLSNIIEDLLVASRAESGELTVTCMPIDIKLQTAQVIESLAEQVGEKRIEHDGRDYEVLGDPGRVRQILRNLLINAIRYGGPSITVTSRAVEDGSVDVTVVDDGPAIPLERRAQIFEPFERAHDRPGVTASVGLGLTISRHLARLMGGDLTYRRTDEGNAFTLTLRSSSVPAARTQA